MKKGISFLLSMALLLSVTSCSTKPANSASNGNATSTGTTPPANEKVVTIKVGYTQGTTDPEGSDEVRYGTAFKEYVEANCDTIKVELYPNGTLGNAQDVVGSIAAGTVQMGVYEASLLNNYDPDTMVFILPGAFRDFDEVNAIIDSEWGATLLAKSSEDTNLMVLGGACKGMRSFTCKGREMRSVEDAAGLTFRVMDSPMYIEMVKAIGANPVPMPGSEMYVAMQNGVVDGQENPVTSVLNDKTYEVQDWYVLDNHSPCIVFYMINKEFYESLSDNQKSVIDTANEVAQEKARAVVTKLTEGGIAELESYGMTVYEPTPEELEGWHNAYGPVCEEYMRKQIGDQLVDELLEEIQAYRG